MTESDSECIRQCTECKASMRVLRHETENSSLPWRDRFTRFHCENCGQETLITRPISIITALCTGIFILSIQLYAVLNGFFDFIQYSFSAAVGFKLLSVFLLLAFIVFSIGAFLNLKTGIAYLIQHGKYPLLKSSGESQTVISTLALGALPWLLAGGLGFINFQFFNDNELAGLLVIPVFLGPILLAPKLNTSYIAVFLGSAFWLLTGLFIAWIY